MSSAFFRVSPFVVILAVLLAGGCTTAMRAPRPLAALEYAGDQQALVGLDREIAAAGQDAAKLSAIATRLLATLGEPGATLAAQQAAAQRLGMFSAEVIAAPEHSAVWLALLTDAERHNVARLALDVVPGAAVDALYLQAFDQAAAPARLALVQSMGHRRIAGATPLLARLLDASDSALAGAAAKSLGQIGTAEALEALRAAPNPAAPEIIAARLAAVAELGGAAAAAEARALAGQLAVPAHLRAAATRALLFAEPDAAPDRFLAALGGGDAALKPVVIEAIATHPAPQLTRALADQLAAWDAPTQAAVIAALARRGDAAAVPAITAATNHRDAIVRAAAIEALGDLPGTPATARRLAELATAANLEESKLAHQSLARLNGPGVADAVLAGAASGDPALRAVFLEQIAARNMTSAVPLLLQTRGDPAPKLRAAALGSLADIAPASEQAAILDWALAARDPAEQPRALRALASVTLRDPDVARRAQPITQALEQASPEVATRLVPVLARIGGADSAASAARLASSDHAPLANAAATTLARWTDATGLPHLVSVAESAPHESTREIAVRGAVTYLTRTRTLPSAELGDYVARLLPVAQATDARSKLVYLLSRCREDAALKLAEGLQSDAEIAETARDAVLAIRANRAGAPVFTATANENDLPNLTDGKPNTRWAAPSRLGQSIRLDFHSTRPVRQVVLDGGGTRWGYPDEVEVIVTDDPDQPAKPAATAAGQPLKTTIDLPAGTRGRYLIVRHSVDDADGWWSMAELVFE